MEQVAIVSPLTEQAQCNLKTPEVNRQVYPTLVNAAPNFIKWYFSAKIADLIIVVDEVNNPVG
jgi:hypothetical protein